MFTLFFTLAISDLIGMPELFYQEEDDEEEEDIDNLVNIHRQKFGKSLGSLGGSRVIYLNLNITFKKSINDN